MKSICFFNSAIAWGGGEKWHLEVSEHMYNAGYKILVCAHKNSELLKRIKIKAIPNEGLEIGNLSFLNPLKIAQLTHLFRRYKIDTVVINLSRDLKLAGLAAKNAGIRDIIYRRGSAIPIKDSLINRYYFKNVITHILVNSKATERTILQNNQHLFPKDKIKVIYNAIDTTLGEQDRIAYPNIFNDGTSVRLMNLGRLEDQKNQKFLIHLAEELTRRNLQFTLTIGGEGRLKNALYNLAIAKNVSDKIIFSGFIKRPEEFIKLGDIFLLPSYWEGFGYVLAEASLCQKPIVAFNASSNPEVVLHNKTGILTPFDELMPFADAVEKLMNNPQLRAEMGYEGRKFIEHTFNKSSILKEVEDYLIYDR